MGVRSSRLRVYCRTPERTGNCRTGYSQRDFVPKPLCQRCYCPLERVRVAGNEFYAAGEHIASVRETMKSSREKRMEIAELVTFREV